MLIFAAAVEITTEKVSCNRWPNLSGLSGSCSRPSIASSYLVTAGEGALHGFACKKRGVLSSEPKDLERQSAAKALKKVLRA